MALWALLFGVVVLAGLLNPQAAFAQGKKVALVIGNAAYRNTSPLANPRSDAVDVSAALEKLGYSVTRGIDLDKAGMDEAIRGFSRALEGVEVGVLFYAGHGLQVDGQNYLVPIDAKLGDASSLDYELVKLETVQRLMERGSRTNIIFLDACRDNPLARNLARSMGTRSAGVGRGLAPTESGVDTLISFSTQPGNVALDGTGRNSPFAGALVKQLLGNRDNVADMLIAVRRDVMKATANRQVPWEHSALTTNFYFSPRSSESGSRTPGDLTPSERAEVEFWNSVKDSDRSSVIRSYMETYPKGLFVPVAKAILADLEDPDRLKTGVDVASLNGSWHINRIGQNCPANRYWFDLDLKDGRISGEVPTGGKITGQVTKSGAIQFSHKGHTGGLVQYQGTLKGSSGVGTFEVVQGKCKGTIAASRL